MNINKERIMSFKITEMCAAAIFFCMISISIQQKEIMGYPIDGIVVGHPIIISDKKHPMEHPPHHGLPPHGLCPRVCPLIYEPICACDPLGRKRTFSNDCLMVVEMCRCRIPYRIIHTGPCYWHN